MKHASFFGRALAAIALPALAIAQTGCEDDAFCFADCPPEPSGVTSGVAQGGAGGSGGDGFGGDIFAGGGGQGQGGGECQITNGGNEICDEIDNDCDGTVDDGIDFADPHNCGTCANNCFATLLNADPATITCDWDGTPDTPGTCAFTGCASDYFDCNGDGLDCEYYCIVTSGADTLCNNKDDDCDCQKDEDVDLCDDPDNCGGCNIKCIVAHGEGDCVASSMPPCTPANTSCAIGSCNDDDLDGNPDWWDIDQSAATGCEYPCSLTNNGVEICGDGIDNDCDGEIDASDADLSGDPQLGQVCYGDPDGLCADPAHAGVTQCVGQQVQCLGIAVLHEDDVPESCNNVDDDCDGSVDDSPNDAGASCGTSNVFPCKLGTVMCQSGMLNCVGAINPQPETCNGIDDDCDMTLDDNPIDAGGACNVPPPPPPNATSPCMAGTITCQGGVLVCSGSAGPTSPNDGCGDDSNCDGLLTGQPNLQSDVANCGMCGNDCYAGAVHSNWACQGGSCMFQGCQPGWFDLDMNQTCEYPCFLSGSEACDGVDNDCDGFTDEGVTPPPPTQVCGVSPAATRPECQVPAISIQCMSGSWVCNFNNANVCTPSCASETEICDGFDNDCDGGFNENVANFGLACKSDDGLAPPGHGACQTSGTFVCNGPNATMCSAVKANCNSLPQGCNELCDDVDNDCDGLVDEDFTAKGSDPAYFIKPVVTKISGTRWIMSYEASRPDASNNNPGSGNGYYCSGVNCPPGIPAAPANVPLDGTIACSREAVLPWFNADPIEAEQACNSVGGFVCSTGDWTTACQATIPCVWGYNPRGAACTSTQTATKFCNLDNYPVGSDADVLLLGGSSNLQNCYADWSNLNMNSLAACTYANPGNCSRGFDLTGNLREITRQAANTYPLMGGGFNSESAAGSTCQFDFYTVNQTFKLFDTGFRCCFSADPRL
jgi:putative metal-binding protein